MKRFDGNTVKDICPCGCGLERPWLSSYGMEENMQTETNVQHTPTPWHIQKRISGDQMFEIYTEGIEEVEAKVALAFEKEDAAFIVRAVNSHEALVEAAKRVRSVLNDEGKEILTKAEMEQLLFEAIAQAEK